ncbi:MAG: hypothetical protein A2201_09490 [Alicyclobacillus sp. RIFOXYA1_FULL_53_8]|nr:MAG: hypothetical protein A2201_09490 [Alicyclobacillus sp. RIFOXYA1_FULL_53_8]
MGVIASHLGMLVALWVVLILLGLSIVVRVVTGLKGTLVLADLATAVTRPLLVDVLPLILLALLMGIDGTHTLVRIWYYVAAVLIALREVVALGRVLQNKL